MPTAPALLRSTHGRLRPLLLFVVVEDWFFASHFLPLAQVAIEAGYDVAVATRIASHRPAIEATGARLIALEGERGSLNPVALIPQVNALADILRREQPALLHLIGLRPILVGSLAARRTGIARRIAHVTGMGLIGTSTGIGGALGRILLRRIIRPVADGPDVRFVFENAADPLTLGLDPHTPAKVTLVGGAGVDPERYKPVAMPPSPPLRLAVVARMLWSKGVDIAVEAVRRARAAGIAVELDLYGEPDRANPRALSEATLREWSQSPGVAWHGRTTDINAVWANHHVAVVPSRGGEGLPRSLLEAAACGRALLVTDVPGCRDFVRNGIEGLIVPPGDAAALTEAIATLAADIGRVTSFGAAARVRLLEGYTETAVAAAFRDLYCAGLPVDR